MAVRSSYDVVIVGGAAVGSSTAFFLSGDPEFHGSVLVIERDFTYARSATALSLASIRHQFSNAINVRISQFGTEFLSRFAEHVAVDGDVPELGFKENGYLFLAGDARGRAVLERNHQVQKACGAQVVLLEPAALAERFPWLRVDDLVLASYGERNEGWFDSSALLQGFRRKARARGVDYVEDEVVAVKRTGDRITGVVTRKGVEIGCGTLVNSSGTRGRRVAAMAGLDIPVEPRRRSVFVVDCRTRIDGRMPLVIDSTGVFVRPEGQFYITGISPPDDPEVDPDDFEVRHSEFDELLWPVLANRIPAFEALKVVNSWAGHYDFCTLDHNVIVGPHPEVTNFLFANGFSGHGVQQSPAIGRGLAEIIVHGRYRTLDLTPLSYARVIAGEPFLEEAVV
jgi:glycine/D-amino acid oxidase-like deaminating enzyme